MHAVEGLGDHRRAHGARGPACVVLEQAGAPAPGQDAIGEQEAGQVEDLAQVVVAAKAGGSVADHGHGIAVREPLGAADAHMIGLVVRQRRDDGALAEQGLDYQRLARIGVRPQVVQDIASRVRVLDVVQAADVERGVGPVAQGDELDDLADMAAPLHQQDIGGANLVLQPVVVGQVLADAGRLVDEPLRQPCPQPVAESLCHRCTSSGAAASAVLSVVSIWRDRIVVVAGRKRGCAFAKGFRACCS